MEEPQQSPQQAPPPQATALAPAPYAKPSTGWYVFLYVFCLIVLLADIGLCAYYTYEAVNYSSFYDSYGNYYYGYQNSFYVWRAGVTGGVAFIAWICLIVLIVVHRRRRRRARAPVMVQFMPMSQWQQPYPVQYPVQPGAQYPQPVAYGPPQPGYAYQQSPAPQQYPPVNTSQV
ncbi:hypothetical protein IWW38_005185 [Coemansia aciculifera]|uniref:Uncharacterized protein n=1 Tax=Coemansia aciculifera TaxID=417176 RepID=A0ACC1LWC0_9FUNG|nr:hypothetical protein IWW38_005185 [Coemansia aciculifera]